MAETAVVTASGDILCLDPHWIGERIRRLDSRDWPEHDLEWITPAGTIRDSLRPYRETGGFFRALLDHSPTDDAAGGAVRVCTTGFLKDPVLLRFARVHCHTGVTLLQQDESFQCLYDKLKMSLCYSLTSAAEIVGEALDAKMDAPGCVHVLLDAAGTDMQEGRAFLSARTFFKRHPLDCLRRLSASALGRIGASAFEHLLDVLGEDDVNVGEADLWQELFCLLQKRYRNDAAAVAAGLGLRESHVPLEEEGERRQKKRRVSEEAVPSIMRAVRPSGLDFSAVMAFRERHAGAAPDSFYMSLLEAIHSVDADAPPPRAHVPTSLYPRFLRFPSDLRGSHVVTTLSALNHSVAYVAAPCYKSGSVAVPPFVVAGRHVLSLTLVYHAGHLRACGTLDDALTRLDDGGAGGEVALELRVVNFCRDRQKKSISAIAMRAGASVDVPKIILISTLDNDYTFCPSAYPEIVKGSHILIKFTCRASAADA